MLTFQWSVWRNITILTVVRKANPLRLKYWSCRQILREKQKLSGSCFIPNSCTPKTDYDLLLKLELRPMWAGSLGCRFNGWFLCRSPRGNMEGAAAALLDVGTSTAAGPWSTGSGCLELHVKASVEQVSFPHDSCSFLEIKSCERAVKVLGIMVTGASQTL